MSAVDHIAGQTWHGRKGAVTNGFRYSVDYVLMDAEKPVRGPLGFARNRAGLFSLRDQDHGGAPGGGSGAAWVRQVLQDRGLCGVTQIQILAQPRVLGHVFNPVSFWLCRRADDTLVAVICEVTNTFGDRHSYFVARDDHGPIKAGDRLQADKILHVSPFQPQNGAYTFRFDVRKDRLGIWIDYAHQTGGVMATLTGRRKPLTSASIVKALLRRPLGARRVLTLIHWQAFKLWWKGARYRTRPDAPKAEVSG